ncbi:MAG: hypothetical protein M3Z02_08705 [Actinomycetota bacterium]|nr:hypothetical protein [Actinomycetota bacterium]
MSGAQGEAGFERLRRRRPGLEPTAAVDVHSVVDAEGKRALFSQAAPQPAAGSFLVECSRCGETSVLSASKALRAALPSVHVPLFRRGHASWMRCPACQRRSWVSLRLQL